jgi:hypothetical protein
MTDLEQWMHFSWRKEKLMDELNAGLLNITEWRRFVQEASRAGMASMADSMNRRLKYYQGAEK